MRSTLQATLHQLIHFSHDSRMSVLMVMFERVSDLWDLPTCRAVHLSSPQHGDLWDRSFIFKERSLWLSSAILWLDGHVLKCGTHLNRILPSFLYLCDMWCLDFQLLNHTSLHYFRMQVILGSLKHHWGRYMTSGSLEFLNHEKWICQGSGLWGMMRIKGDDGWRSRGSFQGCPRPLWGSKIH